jgi:leucine-rich repeat protein SHOC2
MEQVELEQIIEKARLDRERELDLSDEDISTLSESIGNLCKLAHLDLRGNQLTTVPESIGNLGNLISLNLSRNQIRYLPEYIDKLAKLEFLALSCNSLSTLPESICNLSNLTELHLNRNQLNYLPESIGSISKLTFLCLRGNQLSVLPDTIGDLSDLKYLRLEENQISVLPNCIVKLVKLTELSINGNPLTDLSILQKLPDLRVIFLDVELTCRYWTKLSDWKAEWLLEEDNAEVRRVLIEQIGYEKICNELNAITLDNWREYTLLKIDGVETIYEEDGYEPIDREPMVLLKMTCPSTQHIHILRVPPEMTSAEAAITWVNHGIHPDAIAVQT